VCERPRGEGCGECSSCRRVVRALGNLPELAAGAASAREASAWNLRLHPDLLLVLPAGEVIKVEQVRALVGEIAEKPFEGRGRAIVVDDAHRMTEQAANTLLKSLEEPPASTHFLLVTPAPQALLPTIRSRCQHLRFGALSAALIEELLLREGTMTAETAALRARLSGGSLGAALAFEEEGFEALRAELLDLLRGAAEGLDDVARIEAVERLTEGADWARALGILRSLLRDVAVLRAGLGHERLLNVDVGESLAVLARTGVGERAEALAEAVARARVALEGHAHRALTLSLLVDALCTPAGLRVDEATW